MHFQGTDDQFVSFPCHFRYNPRMQSKLSAAIPALSNVDVARRTQAAGEQNMNEYKITFTNGEIVEIEAWTPEAARVIAIEDTDLEERPSNSVASVELLTARQIEL